MAEQPNFPLIAVIMAGGSGTRFWPMSRTEKPKQYLTLFGNRSLIQATTDRLKKKISSDHIFVCSGENQTALLKEQLPELRNLILEPCGRNTASCLMLSVATLLSRGFSESSVMGVFPSDHVIGDNSAFLRLLDRAAEEAFVTKDIITFGIKPTSPHTGYGYIEASSESDGSSSRRVKRFVEKPSLEKAQEYLKNGNFFWNAGIFFWRLDTVKKAFETFLSEEWNQIQTAVQNGTLNHLYPKLKQQSIDVAVLEKISNVRVIPAEMNWSDIGSWNALLEHVQHSTGLNNVVLPGSESSVQFLGSNHCLVASESAKKIVLIGLDDLIVVETKDAILVTHRAHDQRVKEIT